jgi:hypothetical protein
MIPDYQLSARARLLLCCGAVALAALLAFSCATTGGGRVSVPAVPAWVAPAAVQGYTANEVIVECARLAPYALVETSDQTFTPISHEWLQAACSWSWSFLKATGITFTAESFDCDKFALGFAYAANVAASRAGVHAQPLLARVFVTQGEAFGGVPAGGGHAVNGFLSDRGLFILEPQTRTLIPLADYPNRDRIFRIKIGG